MLCVIAWSKSPTTKENGLAGNCQYHLLFTTHTFVVAVMIFIEIIVIWRPSHSQ